MSTVGQEFSHHFAVRKALSQEWSHHFAVRKAVGEEYGHHFAVANYVGQEFSHHFAVAYPVGQEFSHHFAVSIPVGREFSHHFRVLEYGAWDSAAAAAKTLWANITITKNTGGTKTIPADSLTISRKKSEPMTWSLTVFDPDGTYNPFNTSSAWEGWLTPEFQPKGAPEKSINITIGNGTLSRDYTDLILMDLNYEASPEGGYTLTLSGADYSQVLFRDNQTMETVLDSTAKTIIGNILEECDIGSHTLDPSPDYPVAQFDFQKDRPINRIQTLLNEWGAHWRMEGQTFKAWIPSVKTNIDWTYKDCDNIYSMRLSEQVMTLYNKVTVCRVQKNADLAYSQEGTTDGRMQGSLSGTFHNPHFTTVTNTGCAISLIDWFFNGTYVGQGAAIAGKVNTVYFTVTPIDPDISSYWKIEARGTPDWVMGTGIDIDASYTYEDEDSIEEFDELPAPDIESNFTATDEMAQIKARAFMREQGRLKRTISLTAPVNPWLELDETVKVDEGVSRYSGYFNVESVTTSLQGHQGEDVLEMVEYEQ